MKDTGNRPVELRILTEVGWLADTPESFRDAVLSRCAIRRYERNEVIFRQGDAAGGIFGLIDGGLGLEFEPEDRNPYLGLVVRPGFWVGEGSILTRRQFAVGLRCTTASLIAHLPLAEWDAVVREDPASWRWIGLLAHRNAVLAIRVSDALMVRGSSARLAAILVVIATSVGATLDDPLEVAALQDQLAGMANLSRSSVEKILAMFEAEGLIERSYRRITILDIAGLRRHKMQSADL